MRRVVTRSSVFALLAACSSTGTLNNTNTAGHVNPDTAQRITQTASSAPADAPPTLVTLRGQGAPAVNGDAVAAPTSGTVYDVGSVAGAVRSIPPGGYVVRGTGSGSTASRGPVPATTSAPSGGYTVATADPMSAPARRPAAVRNTAHRSSPSAASSGASFGSSGGGMAVGGAAAPMVRADRGRRVAMEADEAMPAPASPPTAIGMLRVPTTTPTTTAAPMVAPPPSDVTVTVSVGPSVVPVQQVIETNILTAASVGDVDRRDNYLEYLSRHPSEREELGIDMTRRVRLRVVDASGKPVNAAQITLSGMGVNIAGTTHADGYWDFYPNVSAPQQMAQGGAISARAEVQGVAVQANVTVPATGDGAPVTLQLPAIVAPPQQATLDLGFAIDVTGSMGDELEYVHREIGSIVQKVQAQNPGLRVRVGATFYRDRVDPVVVQQIPFTSDVPGFANAMMGVRASGGGDYPEDMNAGLEAAMTKMAWSDGAAVRVLVLIADAPPQHYPDGQFTYTQAMMDASRRGIRILPVGASGADRTVEYLFRALGAFTSTPYVYLTDDSGVGSSHMEADTDRVGVEKFADLLVRMVSSDLRGEGMHEPGPLGPN